MATVVLIIQSKMNFKMKGIVYSLMLGMLP